MPRWTAPIAAGAWLGRVELAVLAVVLATLVSLALAPLVGRALISPYLIAVIALARYGGLGSSLIACVLSVLAADYFLFEPRFALWPITLNEVITVSFLAVVASSRA